MTDLPQLQLLASACRRAFRCKASNPAPVITDGAEWLLPLARRHRAQGLCWKALAQLGPSVPQSVADDFRQETFGIAEQGLRAAAASRKLLARFESAGLPLLFLKGQAAGQLAYGDPFLKMSSDIDILVRQSDIEPAAALLKELGYKPIIPVERARISEWHRQSKESVWTRPGSPPVELHSRVADHPSLLPEMTACSPRQLVDIGFGVLIPTFARDELFAYLAVHGASSAWFRLKWLSDFAGILEGLPEVEIDRLYRRSLELGAGRAPGWALLLSHYLFETAVSPGLLRELRDDRALRLLVNTALRELCSVREPTARLLGTLAIHASQLLLKRDLAFALSEGVRQIRAIGRAD